MTCMLMRKIKQHLKKKLNGLNNSSNTCVCTFSDVFGDLQKGFLRFIEVCLNRIKKPISASMPKRSAGADRQQSLQRYVYKSLIKLKKKIYFPSISYYFHIPKIFLIFFPHTGKNRNTVFPRIVSALE